MRWLQQYAAVRWLFKEELKKAPQATEVTSTCKPLSTAARNARRCSTGTYVSQLAVSRVDYCVSVEHIRCTPSACKATCASCSTSVVSRSATWATTAPRREANRIAAPPGATSRSTVTCLHRFPGHETELDFRLQSESPRRLEGLDAQRSSPEWQTVVDTHAAEIIKNSHQGPCISSNMSAAATRSYASCSTRGWVHASFGDNSTSDSCRSTNLSGRRRTAVPRETCSGT